jgi:hypothetical protein
MAKDCLWQRELKKKFVMIYVSRITDIKNKNLVNNINNSGNLPKFKVFLSRRIFL